jgi:hypothetical protein
LRLEKIYVSAARDVKGMAARTNAPSLIESKRQTAAADWAEQHG